MKNEQTGTKSKQRENEVFLLCISFLFTINQMTFPTHTIQNRVKEKKR